MRARRPRWQVRCDDYRRTGLVSREAAERYLATVQRLGTCRLEHHVEEEAQRR